VGDAKRCCADLTLFSPQSWAAGAARGAAVSRNPGGSCPRGPWEQVVDVAAFREFASGFARLSPS